MQPLQLGILASLEVNLMMLLSSFLSLRDPADDLLITRVLKSVVSGFWILFPGVYLSAFGR